MTVEYYDGLEATIDNLARLIGEDGLRDLVAVFGGRELYIPRAPGEHHPISVAVGQARAEQLAGAFHGVKISVPMRPDTAREIRQLAAEGLTRRAIAAKVRVTERWVYKVLEESDQQEPARQPGLFG